MFKFFVSTKADNSSAKKSLPGDGYLPDSHLPAFSEPHAVGAELTEKYSALKLTDYPYWRNSHFKVRLSALKAISFFDKDHHDPWPKTFTEIKGVAHSHNQKVRKLGSEEASNKFDLTIISDEHSLARWEKTLAFEVGVFNFHALASNNTEFADELRLYKLTVEQLPTFPPTPLDGKKLIRGAAKPPTVVVKYWAARSWHIELQLPDSLYKMLWDDIKNGSAPIVDINIELILSGTRTDEEGDENRVVYSLGPDSSTPIPLLGWLVRATWS